MLTSLRFWRLGVLVLSVMLVGGMMGFAAAGGTPPETRSGTTIKAVKIVRSATGGIVDLGLTSPAIVTTTTMSVPANTKAILLITFSAETACYDANGSCVLNILVDDGAALPEDFGFNFDSSDLGEEGPTSWESHSIQRSTNVLTAGTHTITVQFRNGGSGNTISWDDWQLTIERILKP